MNKGHIRTLVQEELKSQVMNPKETIVTEGILRQMAYGATGATIGGAFGLQAGAWGLMALALEGIIVFSNPVVIGILAALSGTFGALGAWGAIDTGKNIETVYLMTAIDDLIKVIKERDSLIYALERGGSSTISIEDADRKFIQLTNEQIQAAKYLNRLVTKDDMASKYAFGSAAPNEGFTKEHYEAIVLDLLPKALQGKATLISEREAKQQTMNSPSNNRSKGLRNRARD